MRTCTYLLCLYFFLDLFSTCKSLSTSYIKLEASKDAYLRYLKDFDKDLSRVYNKERFVSFIASVEYINEHYRHRSAVQEAQKTGYNVAKGQKGKERGIRSSEMFYYELGLTEMSDWLHSELPFSLSTSTNTALAATLPYESKASASTTHTTSQVNQLRRRTTTTSDESSFSSIGEGGREGVGTIRGGRTFTTRDDESSFSSMDDINKLSVIDSEDHRYDQNLNWANTHNPFNKSICGIIRNQGVCGACWSFVATSAIQAAVYMADHRNIQLSEQELIDCDTFFNRGCQGMSLPVLLSVLVLLSYYALGQRRRR